MSLTTKHAMRILDTDILESYYNTTPKVDINNNDKVLEILGECDRSGRAKFRVKSFTVRLYVTDAPIEGNRIISIELNSPVFGRSIPYYISYIEDTQIMITVLRDGIKSSMRSMKSTFKVINKSKKIQKGTTMRIS